MQRRMIGKCYVSSFIILYLVIAIMTILCIRENFIFFVDIQENNFELVPLVIYELTPFALYDLIHIWAISYMVRSFCTLVGKIIINKSGIQVIIFSKIIFQATWNELKEIGLVISFVPSPIHAPVGKLFFSKKSMHLKPSKTGSELMYRFTNSHRAVIWDVATEILKPDLMKYIPTERLIWIRDKNFSKEKFYRLKYQTNWDSKE